jgi:putative membrane protein
MVQHLMILDIAALLIVLGLTGPMLQPLLAIRWLRWIRALAHPIVSFFVWVAVLYVWHIPALYEGATFDSEILHALEHATFFFAGIGIWLSLFGPLPKPEWFGNGAKVAYVIAVRLAGTVLANVLMWAGSPLYPDYEPTQLARGVEPLSDQGTAGTVMMFESTVLTLGTLTWLFFQWARQDIEKQELLDLADREGVELDPARARRAVAAGQGERLRERIQGHGVHQ